ncbi:MAG: hypothetical protein NVSMB6_30920 [Burkholderiaceae bacterium]
MKQTQLILLAAILLSVVSQAHAGEQTGLLRGASCTVVRFYVAKYTASAAEAWARSSGATEAEIHAARRCLSLPSQTAQAAHWTVQ